MSKCSCHITKRNLVFFMFGSVMTILLQQIMLPGAKVQSRLLTMVTSGKQTSNVFFPIGAKVSGQKIIQNHSVNRNNGMNNSLKLASQHNAGPLTQYVYKSPVGNPSLPVAGVNSVNNPSLNEPNVPVPNKPNVVSGFQYQPNPPVVNQPNVVPVISNQPTSPGANPPNVAPVISNQSTSPGANQPNVAPVIQNQPNSPGANQSNVAPVTPNQHMSTAVNHPNVVQAIQYQPNSPGANQPNAPTIIPNQPNSPGANQPNVVQLPQTVPNSSAISPLLTNVASVGPETKIYRWNGGSWIQLPQFCAGNQILNHATLRTSVGSATIYIHDVKDDKYVSGSLKTHGNWDLADINAMTTNLRNEADIGFIDIGSHVGTFSLVAALMGKKVVAVDPLVNNLIRFCKSIQANNFTDQITLFHAAVSNSYRKVSFKRDSGNIGGTRIQDIAPGTNTQNVNNPDIVDTVRLDDLIQYIPFKRAFIKMDIEEHEYEAVTSGGRFFNEIDVRGILMEWLWHKTGKNGLKLRDVLVSLNYKPYSPDGTRALNITQYQTWPNDVLWKKV